MSKTALITGASSGIGAELAKIHAKSGGGLILIARSTNKLEKLKSEIKGKAAFVHCITQDLCEANAAQLVYNKVEELNIEIDFLINNAGFGGQGYFYERNWEDEKNMMQLNMIVLSQLCHFFLPKMIKKNSGKILNIASSAGLTPGGPMQSIYFATKSFVISFSNGIALELEDTNVSVTSLCPGPTATEFEKSANLHRTKLFSGKVYSAESVAIDGYNAMIKGTRIKKTALNFKNKLNFALIPILPKKIVLTLIKKRQTK